MLDENLPTFSIRTPPENPLASPIYLRENGEEPKPEYTLRRPDPNIPASKNCYAVALYDSYSPEVLYAEVLVQPEWTQPTLSAAEIRAHNGIPPPPVPIVPDKFIIQLYNPDQQIVVRLITGTWNTSSHWEFDMPQNSFRVPSAAGIDRKQNDPAASEVTPKIGFKWKRDGKLSKDISCYLAGKSTDGKKHKEPDITVAMFRTRGDLTIYQPNMHRVDVEDNKGLEVALILSATVIKDIYFNPNREMFNIGNPTISSPGGKRKNSGPAISGGTPPLMSGAVGAAAPPPRQHPVPPSQILPTQSPQIQVQNVAAPSPAMDPRKQWEVDAETERLKKMVAQEERARERAERDEQRRIKRMLDAEEKERKRREQEVAKETERLRKQYGVVPPPMPPRPDQAPPQIVQPNNFPQWQSAPHTQPVPFQRPLSTPSGPPAPAPYSNSWFVGGPGPSSQAQIPPQQNSPYLQAPGGQGTASSSGFFGLGGKKIQKKRSVFF